MVVSTFSSLHLSPFLFWKTFDTSLLKFGWSCEEGESGWKPYLSDKWVKRLKGSEVRRHSRNGEGCPDFTLCNRVVEGAIHP